MRGNIFISHVKTDRKYMSRGDEAEHDANVREINSSRIALRISTICGEAHFTSLPLGIHVYVCIIPLRDPSRSDNVVANHEI